MNLKLRLHLMVAMVAVLVINRISSSSANNIEPAPLNLTIKLALFVDSSLKRHLETKLNFSTTTQQVEEFFRVYVAQIEHNFVGLRDDRIGRIRFELTHTIDLDESQVPSTSDIDLVIDKFCQHQADLRTSLESTKQSSFWHLSLLLTANDLTSDGDSATMGMSLVNGIRWPDLACLVVEFGVNYDELELTRNAAANQPNEKNTLNPSRGFASAWVAAHEIGHSLGLHHDGPPFNSKCNPRDHMMSPNSYVDSINSTWSICSIEALTRLDQILIDELRLINTASSEPAAVDFEYLPGQVYDAQDQCRIFSNELNLARHSLNNSICDRTIQCQSSREETLVSIGPALEGTFCSDERTRICIQYQCLDIIKND